MTLGKIDKKKILAIVPAYNEEKNIAGVIETLSGSLDFLDIVVINDGSADNTVSIAENTQKAVVINLPCNLGIGGAVQTGFKFAQRNDYDIAFQFDGDGQHSADDIKTIIEPILNGKADIVIGSRFIEKDNGFKSTFMRRIGIWFFKYLNFCLIRQRITDNTSGFRAFNKKSIHFFSSNYPTDYPEPEAVILAGKNNLVMQEVAVRMKERSGGQSSISGFGSAYYMIKVTLSILMCFSRRVVTA